MAPPAKTGPAASPAAWMGLLAGGALVTAVGIGLFATSPNTPAGAM